jgi:hypothetical protein
MPRGYLARWTVLSSRAVYPPEGGADPYIMALRNCQRRGENFP